MKPSQIIVLSLSVAAACSSQPSPATPKANPEPAQRAAEKPLNKTDLGTLLKLTTRYAGQGDPTKAARYASLAVKQYPDQPDAWAMLGLTEAQAGQLVECIASYEKSLALGQKRREVFEQLASVYDIQKRYADAARIYRSYLTLEPSDPVMLHQLGLSLLGTGDLPAAIAHLTRAEKAMQSTGVPEDLYVDLGYAHIATDNWPTARGYLAKVFDPAKQKPMPLELLVSLLGSMTEPKAALELIDTFGDQPPGPKLSQIRAHVATQVK